MDNMEKAKAETPVRMGGARTRGGTTTSSNQPAGVPDTMTIIRIGKWSPSKEATGDQDIRKMPDHASP